MRRPPDGSVWIGSGIMWAEMAIQSVHIIYSVCVFIFLLSSRKYHVTIICVEGKWIKENCWLYAHQGNTVRRRRKKIIYPSDQKQWSALSTPSFQLDPLETARQREVAAGGPLCGPLWKPRAQTQRGRGRDGCWAPFDQAPASVPASVRHSGCGSGFGRRRKKPKVSGSFHSLCTYMGRAHGRPFWCNNWLVLRWKIRKNKCC